MKIKLYTLLLSLCLSSSVLAEPKILAKVNGHPITEAALKNFMLRVKTNKTIEQALNEMITVELLADKRLKQEIKEGSPLALELDRNRKALLAGDALENILKNYKITDDIINAEYEKQYKSAKATSEFNANHILVKTEKEALNLIEQLNQKADFEALAKQHSTGPSGKNGGALGWFTTDVMVKPFSDAVANLKKGTFSQKPVQTQFGWHIIKLNDQRSKPAPPLSEVKDKIIQRLSALKINEEIAKIQKAAKIVVPE